MSVAKNRYGRAAESDLWMGGGGRGVGAGSVAVGGSKGGEEGGVGGREVRAGRIRKQEIRTKYSHVASILLGLSLSDL